MSLKISPLSLGDKAIGVLTYIQDGSDVFGSSDADYIRWLDAKWSGLVKIGRPRNPPPLNSPPAHFSVRCTPKGKRVIAAYLAGNSDGI